MITYKTNKGSLIQRVLKGRCNVFLITCKGIKVLVDTGMKKHFSILRENLDRIGVEKIDFLFLTHSHFDHVENAAEIQKLYNAKVIINSKEAGLLSMGKTILPDGTNILTRSMVRLAVLLKLPYDYPPCNADIEFDKTFMLAEQTDLKAIATPGHSIGSSCLMVDNEVIFAGDTLFGRFKNTVYPIFSDDPHEMIKSWKLLLDTPANLYLPGHGSAKNRNDVLMEYSKRMK